MFGTPKICLTLTARTLKEDVALARKYARFADLAELRADCLDPSEFDGIASFPALIPQPCILTVRHKRDGGRFDGPEEERCDVLENLRAFAFVDLESDIDSPRTEDVARSSNTRVIRSTHFFSGTSGSVAATADSLCRSNSEIPKIAFMPRSLADVTDLFRAARGLPVRDRIFCAMGAVGFPSRVLARFSRSFLTFASPGELYANMSAIGHIGPEQLCETYAFREIDDSTRLCGVAGWPLKVTSSPEVHRAMCRRDGINSVMVPLPCEDVAEAINFARELSMKGLAVTIPHKEALLAHLDEIDDAVRAIGAANTIVFRDGKALGYNTDAAGFARALLAFLDLDELYGTRTAILGAGGAARAIAYAIHRLGGEACVHARDRAKAEAVAAPYGFGSATLADLGSSGRPDIIVQCTSVGHGSTDPADDPVPDYAFDGGEAVYDLVYKPATTPLLARASAAGCRVESGMSMLRAQAEFQHSLFHAEVLKGGL